MFRAIRLLFGLCLIACGAMASQAAPRAKHVFIISFDGGKPAVMQQSLMPTLFTLVRKGACTWNAQTTYPSITLTSHTSMLTGVGPEKHKVLWNDWDAKKGLIATPTALSLAHQSGLKTGLFAGKPKFRHLSKNADVYSQPAYQAKKVAAEAANYIVQAKPNLCFIHFSDGDGAGHKYGWGTPQQKQAFSDADDALRTVLTAIRKAGIEKESVVILSADHGGHAKTHGSRSPEDMTIPWIAWGAGVKPGFQITDRVTTYDTAATALWLLDIPRPKDWQGKPVQSAFIIQ